VSPRRNHRAAKCPSRHERQAICARILETGACAPRTFSDYVQDYGKWASINTRGWVQTERYSAERPAAALGDQPLESITSAFVEGAFERLLAGRSGATRVLRFAFRDVQARRQARPGRDESRHRDPQAREAGGRTVFLKPDEETAGRQALPARLGSAFTRRREHRPPLLLLGGGSPFGPWPSSGVADAGDGPTVRGPRPWSPDRGRQRLTEVSRF
jgi:hypothetical protein